MAEPSNDSEKSDRLPFEPASHRKKQPKKAPVPTQPVKAEAGGDTASQARDRPNPESMQIPQVVSRRMARRMAFFCGIPSDLGVATFFVSYLIVSKDI
ncbi:MAG: DUF3464 family protein, partial [Microcoleus sp. SIO2G3]|nr:DUF3464 family protein [Microcoleus sp. SIO2G3]